MTVIGNVLEKGPDSTTGLDFMHTRGPLNLYWEDNIVIGAPVNSFDNNSTHTLISSPNVWNNNIVVLESGENLKYELLENAGARPWDRDVVDKRIIREIRDGSNRIIDSEQEVGGYPSVKATYREFDPEIWGLNK